MTKFLLFTLAFVTTATAGAETCGQLAGVRGNEVAILRVQRGRAGKETVRYAMKIAEKSSTPIECDDVVQAGKDSSARVILPNAKLSLGSDTRIEIAAHTGSPKGGDANVSLLNLTYGRLRALVNRKAGENGETVLTKPQANGKAGAVKDAKKDAQATFEVKTFSAVAGVRGTDFFVGYDPNTGITQQATIEGAVEVAQAGTMQKVLVDGGKQVSVETTPQAVRLAQARIRSGEDKPSELPKKLPGANQDVKPLVVVAINEPTRDELRRTSAAVNDDADFSSKKAVETLGAPRTWTLKREALPDSLKNIKNEY